LELLDVLADAFDSPSQVVPERRALRSTNAFRSHEERPVHPVPLSRVDGRRVHADQHLVILDHRLVDFAKLEDVRRAVPLANDRFHACPLAMSLRPLARTPSSSYAGRERAGHERRLARRLA
jgi:hypothetical protein